MARLNDSFDSKKDRIFESNRKVSNARAQAPYADMAIGAFIMFMGFAMGPPIAGFVFGAPLLLIGLWGHRRGGYSYDDKFTRRWLRKINHDLKATESMTPDQCDQALKDAQSRALEKARKYGNAR